MADVETQDAAVDPTVRSQLVQQIAAPIAPGNPGGDDVTYDDDFQRIKAEVDKLESASADGVAFDLVVELSRKVLTSKSKDLRVATYLAMGLTNTRGLQGAAEGVAAVYLLTQTFWADLHPPLRRAAARRNALQALSDRLKDWVAAVKPEEADRGPLEQAAADARALQDFVIKAMGEEAPAVSGLVRAFEEALRRVPRAPAQAAPAASPQTPAPSQGDTTPAPHPVQQEAQRPAPAAEGDFRSVAEAERGVFRVTAYLRAQEKANPVPYKLARAVRWGALQQEPPSDGGKTMLPAPPAQRRTFLAGLLDRGEYLGLLEEAEVSFQETPFWLDLQRLLVVAMDGLGTPFARARDAILYETAVLLDRCPGLPALRFNDDTPFADVATQGWIEMRVAPVLAQGEAAPASAVDGAADGRLSEQFQEARSRLASDDLPGALALLQQGAEQDGSPKERFHRRLFIATICLKGGQPAIARPMLEELDETVRTHALDVWDPALALEVWTHLYRVYDLLAGKQPKTPEAQAFQSRAHQVFDRVCCLDAGHALSLLGKH